MQAKLPHTGERPEVRPLAHSHRATTIMIVITPPWNQNSTHKSGRYQGRDKTRLWTRNHSRSPHLEESIEPGEGVTACSWCPLPSQGEAGRIYWGRGCRRCPPGSAAASFPRLPPTSRCPTSPDTSSSCPTALNSPNTVCIALPTCFSSSSPMSCSSTVSSKLYLVCHFSKVLHKHTSQDPSPFPKFLTALLPQKTCPDIRNKGVKTNTNQIMVDYLASKCGRRWQPPAIQPPEIFSAQKKRQKLDHKKRKKTCRPSYLWLARGLRQDPWHIPTAQQQSTPWNQDRRPRHLLVMPNCIKFTQHSMDHVTHLLQQLFVRAIVHVANNLPLLQHVLVKVVPGL